MPAFKPQFTSDVEEFDTRTASQRNGMGIARLVDSVRLGLTVFALLASTTIVATSADALGVYNKTHLGQDFFLPLWPNEFDVRPNIALIACGSIILITSAVSLALSKLPSIHSKPLVNSSISFLAPVICLIAALIGASFFYGVNSSKTVSSVHSWSCQWSNISMDLQPHWRTLCRESKTALYLAVLLIPVELLVLGAAASGIFMERKNFVLRERKGSPALS